jgi:hypothetical protein
MSRRAPVDDRAHALIVFDVTRPVPQAAPTAIRAVIPTVATSHVRRDHLILTCISLPSAPARVCDGHNKFRPSVQDRLGRDKTG